MPRRPTSSSGDDYSSEHEHEESGVERTVRHAMVNYTDPEGGGAKIAYRGEKITLTEEECERLDSLGAFEETYDAETMESAGTLSELAKQEQMGNVNPTPEQPEGMPPTTAPTTIPEQDDISEMDDDALHEFVDGSSVGDIAEKVATGESAQRVIDMENTIRGGEARKTLIQAMEAIIAQELAAADNNDDDEVEDLTGEGV
jgi:hypothetical protein